MAQGILERPAPATGAARAASPESSATPNSYSLLSVGVPAVLMLVAGWSRRWVAEDAFINFRVVDQILHGHGAVFNGGERVEVATSTLWLAILTIAKALGGWLMPVEWWSVALGLALTTAGVVMVQLGARSWWGKGAFALPCGVLVLVALPPVWDFATSGLEMGLVFAWLGGCWLLLNRRSSIPTWGAVLLGLGPLIRPELLIFSVAFLAVACIGSPHRVRLLAAGLALPVVYELFRVGYYATLVPNTALAKSATSLLPSRGWDYAVDFVQPYYLWVPLLVLLVVLIPGFSDVSKRRRLVGGAMVGAGLLSALYVVSIGGDFMHARLLLPAVFAILAPVAQVPAKLARALVSPLVAVAIVALWAVAAAGWFRVPYVVEDGTHRFDNERQFYQGASGRAHPVTLDDYDAWIWAQVGERARQLNEKGNHQIVHVGITPSDVQIIGSSPHGVVLVSRNIGMLGYAAGPDVRIVDEYGLADPIGARLELQTRGRAGHEKLLPPAWITARYATKQATQSQPAHDALGCGSLRSLRDAIDEPLTVGRFLSNAWHTPALTRLQIPSDPVAARKRFCTSSR